jgi:hypothetical protein
VQRHVHEPQGLGLPALRYAALVVRVLRLEHAHAAAVLDRVREQQLADLVDSEWIVRQGIVVGTEGARRLRVRA